MEKPKRTRGEGKRKASNNTNDDKAGAGVNNENSNNVVQIVDLQSFLKRIKMVDKQEYVLNVYVAGSRAYGNRK